MKLFDDIGDFVENNKSGISIGLGIIFSIVGAVFTARAAVKSKEKIDQEKEIRHIPKEENLPPKDVVKLCWKDWIPPVLSSGCSFGAIIYGKNLDTKALKSLAPISLAYEIGEKLADECGKELTKKIEEKREVVVEKKEVSESDALSYGETYFWEPYFGRVFISTTNKVDRAINLFNQRLNEDETGSYNDLVYEIWFQTPCRLNKKLICDIGESVGYSADNGLLEPHYDETTSIELDDGRIISAIILKLESNSKCETLIPTTFHQYI